MLNQRAAGAVERSTFSKRFCKPLYDSYCFSRVPATIEKLLTQNPKLEGLPLDTIRDEKYDTVLLLFVDGFGWRFFEKYRDKYPFLKRFVSEGIASKITSQFPSTTAAHVTCMSTGLNVGQSGVYEWFYYEPKVDRVIAPILFSYGGDKESGTLEKSGVSPKEIYPQDTLYQRFHKMGMTSYIVQHASISHSVYSQMMFNGAKLLPYSTLKQACTDIVELCLQPRHEPLYAYFYFGDIDSMGHRHGIESAEFERAVDQFWTAMEEEVWKKISKTKNRVACLVIADHGMVAVEPKETFYLNREIPEVTRFIKKNRQGKLIAPAGSCRDFFLHIEETHVLDVRQMLEKRLKDRAEVYLIEELTLANLFGSEKPSNDFLKRVGNVVILPYEETAVWWHEPPRFQQHFFGAHGGLTRGEMETIFLFNDIQ